MQLKQGTLLQGGKYEIELGVYALTRAALVQRLPQTEELGMFALFLYFNNYHDD